MTETSKPQITVVKATHHDGFTEIVVQKTDGTQHVTSLQDNAGGELRTALDQAVANGLVIYTPATVELDQGQLIGELRPIPQVPPPTDETQQQPAADEENT